VAALELDARQVVLQRVAQQDFAKATAPKNRSEAGEVRRGELLPKL